jgi:hypothetical protein
MLSIRVFCVFCDLASDTILFQDGYSTLTWESLKALDGLVSSHKNLMAISDQQHFDIYYGPNDVSFYHQKLALKRCETVRDYLLARGDPSLKYRFNSIRRMARMNSEKRLTML